MTLYEIDALLLEAIDRAFDEETGEILNEDAMEDVEALQIAKAEKCEGIALMVKNLSAEAKAVKEEKMALAKRQKSLENKVERLKTFLAGVLEGQKFSTPRVSVTFRKSDHVEIEPLSIIPEHFLRYKEPDVDKVALKAALKNGENIEGCTLVTTNSINIK